MRSCPFCAEDIQDAAIVCKHCGRDVPSAAPIQANTATPTPNPARNAAIGCATVLVLMLGGCLALMLAPESEESRLERERDNARAAVTVVCEQAVKQRLKAPASADFPFGHMSNVESFGDDRYRLRSYVDAQNSFGAMIRTSFTCVVEGRGDGVAGYRVVELSGLD